MPNFIITAKREAIFEFEIQADGESEAIEKMFSEYARYNPESEDRIVEYGIFQVMEVVVDE